MTHTGNTGVQDNKTKHSKESKVEVSYFDLYRYGTLLERTATCLGVLLSWLSGAAITVDMTALGEMSTALVERTHPPAVRASTHLPIIATFGGGRRLFNATHEENMAALLEDAAALAKCGAVSVIIAVLLITLGVALVSWSALRQYRYGTLLERTATCLGVLLSWLSGAAITVDMTALGEMSTALVERTHPPAVRASTHLPIIATFGGGRRLFNATHEENMAALLEDAAALAKCGAVSVIIAVLLITLGVALVSWSALRQITTIRMLFLKAVLHQDMSWFDTDREFNLASIMSE